MSFLKLVETDGLIQAVEIEAENLLHAVPVSTLGVAKEIIMLVTTVAGDVIHLPISIPANVITTIESIAGVADQIAAWLPSLPNSTVTPSVDAVNSGSSHY